MNALKTRSSRGQGLVEFGLIVIVLVFTLTAVFDLGRGIYYYSIIYNAAREGARYGIINPDDTSGIYNRANRLTAGLGDSLVAVNYVFDADGSRQKVSVTVTTFFRAVTPLLEPFLGPTGTIRLRSTSTMRIESTY